MRNAIFSLLAATFVVFGVSASPLVRRGDVQFNPPVESLVAPFVNTTDATKRSFAVSDQEVNRRGDPESEHDDDPICAVTETKTGRIKVFDKHECLGYVRMTPNVFGEFGITTDKNLALTISFEYDPSTPETPFGLFITNGPLFNAFPLIGAVVGFSSTNDDFGPNSYNYAYLAGTAQTHSGYHPAIVDNSYTTATGIPKSAEGAIWTYNPQNEALSPQWVNTNFAKVDTFIVYTHRTLALTGDVTAFTNTFGGVGCLRMELCSD